MSAPVFDDLNGWPPEGKLFALKSLSLAVKPGDHPYHLAHAAQAAENWAAELAAKPALFDGRIVFQHRVGLNDGHLSGEAYVVPYSTFLYWRKQQARQGAVHLFAFAVLISSDGALIAIRMGDKTLNGGQIYFAAGSLEPADVIDGFCDIDFNMRREVLEETGIDLSSATVDPTLYASHTARNVTLYRLFRFEQTADEMVSAIRAHHDEDEEIDDAVAIRSGDVTGVRYATAMLPLIAWYFGEPQND